VYIRFYDNAVRYIGLSEQFQNLIAKSENPISNAYPVSGWLFMYTCLYDNV